MPNCVQDGTRSRPNGAAETLRHQKGENKERKTHAFLYKGIYFHRIALGRSFPMRIFSADNLVYYLPILCPVEVGFHRCYDRDLATHIPYFSFVLAPQSRQIRWHYLSSKKASTRCFSHQHFLFRQQCSILLN